MLVNSFESVVVAAALTEYAMLSSLSAAGVRVGRHDAMQTQCSQ